METYEFQALRYVINNYKKCNNMLMLKATKCYGGIR